MRIPISIIIITKYCSSLWKSQNVSSKYIKNRLYKIKLKIQNSTDCNKEFLLTHILKINIKTSVYIKIYKKV